MQLDHTIVHRWFALVTAAPAADVGLPLTWTAADLRVLRWAEETLVSALDGREPVRPPAVSTGSAGRLADYLASLAAGVAETRRQSADPRAPLDLAAGLLAGAAAIGGATGEVSAARSHRAGMVAVEAVVAGADLPEVAKAAAVALEAPLDLRTEAIKPQDSNDVRLSAMIGRLLAALVRATRPARTGPDSAACGATPDQPAGRPFRAEVQFVVFGGASLLADLERAMVADSPRSDAALDSGPDSELVIWSDGDRHAVHVHTADAGRLISEAFAVTTLFDLQIRWASE